MIVSWNLRFVRKALGRSRPFSAQTGLIEESEATPRKTYSDLQLDDSVVSAPESQKNVFRNHPGRLKGKIDHLPDPILKAMRVLTEGRNMRDFHEQADSLRKQLWGRHLPPEEEDYKKKISEEKDRVNQILDECDFDVESDSIEKLREKVVRGQVQRSVHPWHQMNVTPETCLQYLVIRTPAEFCSLFNLFREIQQRDPDFSPRSYFDFGSGVASGYWALREVWKKDPMEAFLVDTNVHMNELALKILQEAYGKVQNGLFFRQFLPAASEQTYDMVVSAYSLLELPSFKDRMDAIAKLWSKTDNYLVIVEDGTNSGYKAIMEARNLILTLEEETGEDGAVEKKAHVFAPCPHDFVCPRYFKDYTPCNFESLYYTPSFLLGKQMQFRHRYSYVILKRGGRRTNDALWPRCVRETKQGTKKVFLKLCQPNGTLEDVQLHKRYICRSSYQCAKRTKWGDRLPGQIIHRDKQELQYSRPKD